MKSSVGREFVINVVVFLVVMSTCGAYLAFSVFRWNPGTEYNSVTMQLNNTSQVLDGTGVFVNGIRIGRVSSVQINADGALLTLTYPREHKIPATTRVEIGLQSALGEPYIDFEPTSDRAPYLRDGAQLSADKVAEPESIPGIFGQIQNLSTIASADPMAGLLKTVWDSFAGTEKAMSAISNGSRLVAGLLMSRTAELKNMFSNTQVYTGDLQWMLDSLPQFSTGITDIITRFRATLDGIQNLVTTTNLYETLSQTVEPFLVKLNSYLKDIVPNVMDAVGPLMPIATALNQTLPHIDISKLITRALNMFGSEDAAQLVVTLPPK